MARFMAISSVSGMTEEKFREALDAVRKWRPDPRTTIIKSYCNLAEGKVVTECEAVEQAQFESWLSQVGWPIDAVYKVDLLHEVGSIWKM